MSPLRILEMRVFFVIGKKPKMLGKWVWGQYATFMPVKDFVWIIRRAEKQKWF